MVDPAIADLPADADDKCRPDHRDIAVDINRRIGDALLQMLARASPARQGPALKIPQGVEQFELSAHIYGPNYPLMIFKWSVIVAAN